MFVDRMFSFLDLYIYYNLALFPVISHSIWKYFEVQTIVIFINRHDKNVSFDYHFEEQKNNLSFTLHKNPEADVL